MIEVGVDLVEVSELRRSADLFGDRYLRRIYAEELGTDRERFVVCSGGGLGIMEAANLDAAEMRGKTIGLNIGLSREQRPNRRSRRR